MNNTKASAANSATISPELVKVGKLALSQWRNGKAYIALGIREKTALGTGTRAAMLATAAYGYEQGKGRVLAMAVRQAMGLDPNVGGIDFPWLEKSVNMRTITPSATVRLDPKDGKMRLMPIGKPKAETKVSPKAKASKPKADSVNGPVSIVRESDKARESAMADIAAELNNGE